MFKKNHADAKMLEYLRKVLMAKYVHVINILTMSDHLACGFIRRYAEAIKTLERKSTTLEYMSVSVHSSLCMIGTNNFFSSRLFK